MTTTERLFDIDAYGGETPKERRAATRSVASRRATLPVEPHVEPWVVLRTRLGVVPFFHLPRGRNDYNSTVALCGLTGTQVTNLGVDEMIRCPLCQLETEL